MFRKKELFLLTLITAALCGCAGNSGGSGLFSLQDSSGDTSVQSTVVSDAAGSESEGSKEEGSVVESSDAEVSKEESSKEESSLSQYEIEYEKLRYYRDSELECSGSKPYAVTYNGETSEIPGYELSWTALTIDLDDFNKDGSPELVVQYRVSPDEKWENQGRAIQIIKYHDGEFKKYQARELIEYTRIAGAGYAADEITDELYVDAKGDLAVLHTRTAGTSPVSAVYYTYSLRDGEMTQTNNLYISREDYYGQSLDQIDNRVNAFFGISDGKCGVYTFGRRIAQSPESYAYLSVKEGVGIQNMIMSLDLVPEFAVGSSVVHNMEESLGYDTTRVEFVSFEELQSKYELNG